MTKFKAFRTKEVDGKFISEIELISFDDLPDNEVIIEVLYSGINYKDLLSSQGNKGITKEYPHTPGIDASGYVVSDKSGLFKKGEEVVVMGYDMGMNTDGGFAEYICVPSAWVLPKPSAFTLKQCMQIGTSGFTAGLGIAKMLRQGLQPNQGPVLVSGATGGVGVYAVQIFSAMGFEVYASTNKQESKDMLMSMGAKDILSREQIMIPKEKAMTRPRFAGGFDAVGGETLVSMLKQTIKSGSVATCGNVGGFKLEMTVFPFILNGINLLGINAADTPMSVRKEVWELLVQYAKPDLVAEASTEIALDGINDALESMANSTHTGRFLINMKL